MSPSRRAFPEDVAARLRSADARLGAGWSSRPDLARHVLGDLLPDDPEGADALAAAVEAGIPERVAPGQSLDALAAELADGSSLTAELSAWSLRVWQSYASGRSAGSAAGATVSAGGEDRAEAARAALGRGRAAAGESLSRDPVVARRVLGDLLPQDPAAVSVLVAAVRDGVPARLAADLPRLPSDLVLPRLAESLTERESIAPDRARWAVAVWADALGLADATSAPAGAGSGSQPGGEATVVRNEGAAGREDPTLVRSGAAPLTGAEETRRRAAPEAEAPGHDEMRSPAVGARRASGPRRGRVVPLLVAGAVVLVAAIAGGTWIAAQPVGRTDATRKPAPTSAASVPSATPTTSPTPTKSPVPALVVLAHRGGDERFAPETAAAVLDAAGRTGVAAETDMRFTSDGVPVLVHDAEVRAPMACSGANPHPVVAETSFSELSRDCATVASASPRGGRYPIPKVADVARKLADTPGAQWTLEIKTVLTPKQEAQVFDLLEQDGIVDRTVLTSFFPSELAKARAEAKKRRLSIRLMLFTSDTKYTPATAARDGLWGVAVATKAVTKAYVDGLHARRVKALAWTPNTAAEWRRMADLGVDLVVTDKPVAWERWNAAR